MSVRSTTLLARKSLGARVGRTISIGLAIVVGVSFVVGSFVLADSLSATFKGVLSEYSEDVDLVARSQVEFGNRADADAEPIPLELADQISGVEGVDIVEPSLERDARIIAADGEPLQTSGAPMLGLSWPGPDSVFSIDLKDGAAPAGADQAVIDKVSAERADLSVGDRFDVITDTGEHTFTLTGLVGIGSSDGFAGATLVALDLPTAMDVFDSGGMVDTIDIVVDEEADAQAVADRVAAELPEDVEVVTGAQLRQETTEEIDEAVGAFGTGLLVFAFVTVFVSAFIINNVFSITIGQRMRELALLRAVGARAKQVRRMITAEALVMSLVATAVGIGGGVLIAKGLLAVFNGAGAGFPETGTTLSTRAIVMALVVGVGVTLLSVAVPARRASRIPPVAAMRPELGFDQLTAKRLVGGAVATAVGAVLFLLGLLAQPGGTPGIIGFAAVGALLLFLGAASVSSTITRPVTRILGWPIAKLRGVPGALARDNAARSPRRTSASASALMVGVALVGASSVLAASLKSSFGQALEDSVQADYVVTDDSFQTLPAGVAKALGDIPELEAVSPIRASSMLVDDEEKQVGAADPAALEQLIDLDMRSGGLDRMAMDTVLVHADVAEDKDLDVGSTLPTTFRNGEQRTLTVAGIYDENTLTGNWLISLETLESVGNETPRDLWVVAKLSDGVAPEEAERAMDSALASFPQANVETNAGFRDSQSGQIDQLLAIVTGLLSFAIAVAVLGISITLALSVFERTREIGLLRAVGMTRRQTRVAVRWEAVIVSVFGALVGLVLGTFIGVTVVLAIPDSVIDVVSFSTPTVVAIVIGAVVAGFIAALYPSRKASRMDVLEAISTE